MSVITVIPGGPFAAGSTVVYTGKLTDGTGVGIPADDLDAVTLTFSSTGSGDVVNNIYRENVLNAGRGTVDAEGNLAITLAPADTAMPGAPAGTLTQRSMVIDWIFNGGGSTGRHEARLNFTAVTEANL